MATRGSLAESALHNDLGIQQNRKFTKPVGIILAVWFIAMASLLGVHYFLKRRPQISKAGILKIHAKYNSLSDAQKTKMKYFESGIIELAMGIILLYRVGIIMDFSTVKLCVRIVNLGAIVVVPFALCSN